MMFPPHLPVCTSSLVIFGGTGDLARRKLLPALFRLRASGALPSDLHVIITGRKPMTNEQVRALFSEALGERLENEALIRRGFDALAPQIRYIQVDPATAGAAISLQQALSRIEGEGAAPARLFYFSLPPDQVLSFVHLLKETLDRDNVTRCPARILLEKPFGRNVDEAQALHRALLEVAREDQILRIDHYLGKEAVQNIMVLRFANVLFEPVWSRHFIDHVQISFAEKIGVGTRAGYFDAAGILRDVVQNHLLQVLSLVAMEPPLKHHMQSIRNEKLKVLQALRPISGDDVLKQCIRAQYTAAGETGASMVGYHQEANIHASSTTETYCALRVFIDSWRWAGVPFYLRAGKRLSTNLTEIAIQFKPVPHRIFPASSGPIQPNVLVIRVQPDEGIHLSVQSKVPGMTLKLSTVQMNFSYQESFGAFRPDAYERLLIDALHGEQSLFIGNEEIETAWRFIDPILSRWQSAPTAPLESYAAGSAGPAGAQTLLEEDGRAWRALGKTAAS